MSTSTCRPYVTNILHVRVNAHWRLVKISTGQLETVQDAHMLYFAIETAKKETDPKPRLVAYGQMFFF